MTVTADIVLRNGTLVYPDGVREGSLAIKNGKIFAIGDDAAMPPAAETLDAAGMHILPGAIDAHVHFREPGYTHKEDWQTGTAAAAMGGVTTVFEMPNVNPPTAGKVELAQKHALAAAKAHVDFGLYGLLGEENLANLEDLVAGGVIGFKCFMGNTFGNLPAPSTGAMLEGFEIVARRSWRAARSICRRRAATIPWRIWPPVPPSSRSRPSAARRSSPNGPGRASMCCTSPRPKSSSRYAKPKRAAWT
jgi:dihydroorotase